ncbi:MAG: glycosyltransferase [Thermomicrobiales bacterium]|nr:glycosyltransferase [Thermomicrobiales bacterium]
MAFDLIRVCVFGVCEPGWLAGLRLAGASAVEASAFDVRPVADDADLARVLADVRPQVVVSVGDLASFPRLLGAPLEVRKRWLHLADPGEPGLVAAQIMHTFVQNVCAPRFPEFPLVSVFTPTYRTGDTIGRPWRSLQDQVYDNWEWVLYDDSPDDGATFARLQRLAREDARVHVFRAAEPSGVIGEVKRRACGLARGAILVELDHDDELTPRALLDVVEAYRQFPDAGFFYTDCAEVLADGRNAFYDEGWGFGYGSYRLQTWRGHEYLVTNYPDINAKTIRHIVGVPNHLRAWTREAYQRCGGHNPDLHVADDYELVLRTFLTTRMVHIRRFGYVQHHHAEPLGNTQRRRNGEIQRLVRYLAGAYNERIHERLRELGVEDFIWVGDGHLDWSRPNPDPTPIANDIMA